VFCDAPLPVNYLGIGSEGDGYAAFKEQYQIGIAINGSLKNCPSCDRGEECRSGDVFRIGAVKHSFIHSSQGVIDKILLRAGH